MRSIRPFILLGGALALLSPTGCLSGEEDDCTVAHKSRLEAFSSISSGRGRAGEDSSDVRRSAQADTLVYVCGVEFDDGYDWRHDSTYGAASGRLVLFCEGVRTLEVPAGAGQTFSLDPDMHILSDGHLYSEGCTSSSTVIGRDGEILFSYEGRESLRGLLVEGDDVYTLGQSRTGQGFSLRKNGELVFSREDGTVCGGLFDSPEYPTGALYRDSGHLYFAYSRGLTSSGSGKAWFVYEDGRETQILSDLDSTVSYDIRIRSGEVSVRKVTPTVMNEYIYSSEEGFAHLLVFGDGTFSLYSPRAIIPRRFMQTYYVFSWRVVCLCGRCCHMTVTPSGEDSVPYLWKDGEGAEIPINGFLTAVEVVLTGKE